MRALIDRWREIARARLEPAAFGYFATGSGEEVSLSRSARSWEEWAFRPHVLRDVSRVDTSCELLGARFASPVAVAPVAYQVMAHADGELATAAAASSAGALYVMATRATRPIEDIAQAAGESWWFQVYMLRDRGASRALVERAVAAGASALMLTVDTPIVGPKPRDLGPLPLTEAQYAVNTARHLPGLSGKALDDAMTQDPSITEEVIGWLADLSGLPVLAKGVLRADDAQRCLEAGAAGLVVSNHGGRQLDGALSTAHALGEVVAVAREARRRGHGTVPVLVDGGIEDGRSVLKALALGADAVMVGRPVVWALAAGGKAGVFDLLEGVRSELADAMMLAGVTSLAECDESLVTPVPGLPQPAGPAATALPEREELEG